MQQMTMQEVEAVAGGNIGYALIGAGTAVAIAGMYFASSSNCDFGFSLGGTGGIAVFKCRVN